MPVSPEEIETRFLIEAIALRYGHDFRGYAPDFLARRLERARAHFACRSLSLLQDRVLHDPAIVPELVSVLTVQVSEMFRDPGYFRALREKVLPHLATYPSLKVWVAGCGEGEELYSLVILFREEGLEARTLFYATDISRAALAKAEAGIYALDRLVLFTDNHRRSGARCSLSDYYTAAYDAAVFDKSLRANVAFSDHSLASDGVFAEVHLVSCRNVLIYFAEPMQRRALGLFEDTLVRQGFLGLGSNESLRLTPHADAFQVFAPGERIYRKTPPAVE